MSYTKVQFIAYRIYTGPGRNPARYVGCNDELEDVRQRVKLMAEAVNNAGKNPEVDPSSDVLKVFVAPEFYFRSMRGGYADLRYFTGAGADRDPNSIVGGLAEVVKDERWADWLFVFGTSVVVAAPFLAQDYKDPNSIWSSFVQFLQSLTSWGRKTAVLNIALVQKGGFADEKERTAKAVIVVKEHMSDIDWLQVQDVVLGPNQVAHFPAIGPGTYELEVNTPGQGGGGGYNGGSIFMLDNTTFGLEVCLDHAMARLRRARPLSGDFFVQIQLIPSGGMVIKPTSVATLQEGLVFNVDGLSSRKADTTDGVRGYHAQLFSVQSPGPPSALSDMKEVLRTHENTTYPANADLAEVKTVFWLPPDNDVKNPSVWAPDLVFYPVVNIPSAAVAKT